MRIFPSDPFKEFLGLYMHLSFGNDESCYLITGQGAEFYQPEEGDFQVKYSRGVKGFKTLVGAFIFYFELEDSASIWDLTNGLLVEEKTKLK